MQIFKPHKCQNPKKLHKKSQFPAVYLHYGPLFVSYYVSFRNIILRNCFTFCKVVNSLFPGCSYFDSIWLVLFLCIKCKLIRNANCTYCKMFEKQKSTKILFFIHLQIFYEIKENQLSIIYHVLYKRDYVRKQRSYSVNLLKI